MNQFTQQIYELVDGMLRDFKFNDKQLESAEVIAKLLTLAQFLKVDDLADEYIRILERAEWDKARIITVDGGAVS